MTNNESEKLDKIIDMLSQLTNRNRVIAVETISSPDDKLAQVMTRLGRIEDALASMATDLQAIRGTRT